MVYAWLASVIIKKENSGLEHLIDEIQNSCDNDDLRQAGERAEVLEEVWERYRKKMSIFVNDERLTSLDVSVARVRPYCEAANDELEAELESIRHQLGIIYYGELPYWFNVV
jgi:hypothetical protein